MIDRSYNDLFPREVFNVHGDMHMKQIIDAEQLLGENGEEGMYSNFETVTDILNERPGIITNLNARQRDVYISTLFRSVLEFFPYDVKGRMIIQEQLLAGKILCLKSHFFTEFTYKIFLVTVSMLNLCLIAYALAPEFRGILPAVIQALVITPCVLGMWCTIGMWKKGINIFTDSNTASKSGHLSSILYEDLEMGVHYNQAKYTNENVLKGNAVVTVLNRMFTKVNQCINIARRLTILFPALLLVFVYDVAGVNNANLLDYMLDFSLIYIYLWSSMKYRGRYVVGVPVFKFMVILFVCLLLTSEVELLSLVLIVLSGSALMFGCYRNVFGVCLDIRGTLDAENSVDSVYCRICKSFSNYFSCVFEQFNKINLNIFFFVHLISLIIYLVLMVLGFTPGQGIVTNIFSQI